MIRHFRLTMDLKVEIGECIARSRTIHFEAVRGLLKRFLENGDAVREFCRMRLVEELHDGDLVSEVLVPLAGNPEMEFWNNLINDCEPAFENQYRQVIQEDLECIYEQVGGFQLVDFSFDEIFYSQNLLDILNSNAIIDNGEIQYPGTSCLTNSAMFKIQSAYIVELKTGFHLLVKHFDVILYSHTCNTLDQAKAEFMHRFGCRAAETNMPAHTDWSEFFDYGGSLLRLNTLIQKTSHLTTEELAIRLNAVKYLIGGEL